MKDYIVKLFDNSLMLVKASSADAAIKKAEDFGCKPVEVTEK